MTKLEQISFDNIAKFNEAIKLCVDKKESFRTYKDKEDKEQSIKIIGNNNIYLGNGYSLNITEAENKKVYVSVQYFSAEDRIAIAKKKKENNTNNNV